MTLRLILVRHAKSAWDDPAAADHDRTLNARGRDAAARIGAWLVAEGHLPDAALVSTATRTRQTWDLIAAQLPEPPEPRFLSALYHAPPEVMLGCLHKAEGRRVLMLGHNPGIAAFARWLLDRPPRHPRFADYPTCATLVAGFPAAAWAEVTPGSGEALAFVTPRELPEPA
jgi:phosphohistidine phosphatase